MANVITDSNGNVLTVNGGAFTVDASVDANITAGNIKKNVSILGVTGTYDGHTAGNSENDVNFRDYDGTIIASYTAAEFANLSALPANPSHSGLVALGWNWSLAGAKTYVARHGGLEIGQMYVTDDGKTRLYVDLQKDSFQIDLSFWRKDEASATIDWGDGSPTETPSGKNGITVSHTYTSAGQYVITLSVPSNGELRLGYSNKCLLGQYEYQKCTLTKVEMGLNVTAMQSYGLNNSRRMESIVLSQSLTIADCMIETSIRYVVVPSGVQVHLEGVGANSMRLHTLSLPEGLTQINSSSSDKYIDSLYVPDSVTAFNFRALKCIRNLEFTIPAGTTSIGSNTFDGCNLLEKLPDIPSTVTTIGASAFAGCRSITQLTLPNGITEIPTSMCVNCFCLKSITIPSGVTSIGKEAFKQCYALTEITIPSLVISIGNNAFQNCYSLLNYYFLPTTPPTFGTTPITVDSAIIHVPHGCLEAYQTAYPDRASQMVEMPANE